MFNFYIVLMLDYFSINFFLSTIILLISVEVSSLFLCQKESKSMGIQRINRLMLVIYMDCVLSRIFKNSHTLSTYHNVPKQPDMQIQQQIFIFRYVWHTDKSLSKLNTLPFNIFHPGLRCKKHSELSRIGSFMYSFAVSFKIYIILKCLIALFTVRQWIQLLDIIKAFMLAKQIKSV